MKPIKFKNQKVFFWADFHGCHAKDFILEPRGFKTADEAKETLISRWNEKVTNEDTGILLGDNIVGAGANGEREFVSLLLRLNAKELYVMSGNHFSGYASVFEKLSTNSAEGTNVSIDGFGEVTGSPFLIDNHYRLSFQLGEKTIHLIPNYFEIIVEGHFVALCHYPVLSFNFMNKNGFMLYGHVHSALNKVDWIAQNYLTGRVLDVGIESCPYPISFPEVQKIMGNKKQIILDHHV